MRYLHINLHYWACAANEIDHLVAYADVLSRHRVLLLKDGKPLPRSDWRDVFQEKKAAKYSLFKWNVSQSICFEDWGGLIAHLAFEQFDDAVNRLSFGGLLDFEFQDQRPLVEPFAQRLLAVGRELYALVHSAYGEIDGGLSDLEVKDISKLRLKKVAWVNFFGPAYVKKYGQDFLLGLPGYKTELLPDGGVFHQLSPTFVAPSKQEAKALRRRVIAYCAQHGLKVTCRAPYVIPGLTPQPEPKEPVTDAEVQEYLQRALATTLVLKDGTRVKSISIPWDNLTPKQRQMALEAIRQAAIAEIKRPGRKHIRFEFDQIPDDLDRLLADLAGRDHPDFEWVQVEMES